MFDVTNLIQQALNFLLLLVLLDYLLYRPITRFMHERSERIRMDIEQAKQDRQAARDMKEQYEKQLEEARNRAREIIEEAVKRAEDSKEEIILQARREAHRLVEGAKKEIRLEREKALADLRDEVTTLAVLAAEKVIEQEMDEQAHHKLISDFISDLEELPNVR